MSRWRPLGLQRRIMLFVTVGLAVLFALFGLVGLGAIDEAAQRVFEERLATAHTTAGIVQRDFARLAADVRLGLAAAPPAEPAMRARDLLATIASPARYDFFQVAGLCLARADGAILADAWRSTRPTGDLTCAGPPNGPDGFEVREARWTADGVVALADVGISLGPGAGDDAMVAVAHVASRNAADAFDPAAYGGQAVELLENGPAHDRAGYSLEILDHRGRTVLAIGPDERLDDVSPHFPAVRDLMAAGDAAALVDPGSQAAGLEPHVMAVVPIGATPLYLLLEQPTDVAFALPNQLRERLILLIVAGFGGALSVAWFTTRRVVTPTEQLTAAAQRMARGDLASPVAVRAQDEVGLLAESLEEMRRRLREATEQAEQANRVLERRVAERTARLGQVLERTISAQEDERRGLARELHDETAQALAALSISLDRARDDLGGDPSAAREHILRARTISERLLVETRRMILGLRPTMLDDLGLGPAIAWYGESSLADQGVRFRLNPEARSIRLPPHIEVSLYRIAQEALSNVAKHARAREVTVSLAAVGRIATLCIEDDGVGFDVEPAVAGASHLGSVGLAGIQERVSLLGGTLTIASSPGSGTTVVVSVPTGNGTL